jgi:hypothetical protein
MSRVEDVQVLDVLEAVAQVAEERVVQVLEHAALTDDVADALGPYDCDTALASGPWAWRTLAVAAAHERLTFILSYVLERECEARILALHDAHLSEGALADDAQQAEVVEVHCEDGQRGCSGGTRRGASGAQ